MGHPAPRGVSTKIELDSEMSVRTFVTAFLDGLTGEGIFGDLRIPGVPDRMFKEEEAEDVQMTKEAGVSDDQAKLEESDKAPDRR